MEKSCLQLGAVLKFIHLFPFFTTKLEMSGMLGLITLVMSCSNCGKKIVTKFTKIVYFYTGAKYIQVNTKNTQRPCTSLQKWLSLKKS